MSDHYQAFFGFTASNLHRVFVDLSRFDRDIPDTAREEDDLKILSCTNVQVVFYFRFCESGNSILLTT
jgi:hypothetical protein